MTQSKSISIQRIGRNTTACSLFALGVWVLSLTVPLPKIGKKLEQVVNHPIFIAHSVTLPDTSEPTYNPLTEYVLSQWGWLSTSQLSPSLFQEEATYFYEELLNIETQLLPTMPQPLILEEPQEESQPTQSISGNWISKTMLPTSSHTQIGSLYVANSGKVSLSDTSVPAFSPISLEVDAIEPQILIYHSHGTESYSPTPGYEYQESDPYRSLQEGRNIISVGEAMAEVFTAAGYSVIHDKTYHDYPDYNSSYSNSSLAVKQYLQEYPSITLIFDVHRDALEDTNGLPYQLISKQEEQDVAQVMLVVGTNGDGYSHDLWRENLDLALSIQETMLNYGDFSRPLTLRSSRFNQHLSTGSLLVEVGGHGNTLPQAIEAGALFAQCVIETIS